MARLPAGAWYLDLGPGTHSGRTPVKKLLIEVRRRFATSPDIAWDVAQDYTHFLFAHRRQFASFDVLHDDGALQVFHYVSKPFPWLPWGVRFVSARRLDPASHSLDQLYRAVDAPDSDSVRFHFEMSALSPGEVEWRGTYLYPVRGVAALVPGLFAALFARRIHRVWGEDEEMMSIRYEAGVREDERCGPYRNPVLSGELFEDLQVIRNLKSQRHADDTLAYTFDDTSDQEGRSGRNDRNAR